MVNEGRVLRSRGSFTIKENLSVMLFQKEGKQSPLLDMESYWVGTLED